jgi:hypothetical protein
MGEEVLSKLSIKFKTPVLLRGAEGGVLYFLLETFSN